MEIFNDEGDKAWRRTKIGGLLNFTKKTGNEKQTPENIRKQKEEKEQAELCEKTRCCDLAGIDEETARNLTQGFAVGIGGSMEATCGAVIGAVNVLGLINKNPQKTMQGSRRIIQSFKEQNGTVICKELKGINDGIVKRECIDCVRDAAALLEAELPESYGKSKTVVP